MTDTQILNEIIRYLEATTLGIPHGHDDEDYNPQDYGGGNADDIFYNGTEFGHYDEASHVLGLIKHLKGE